jgi:hypothetical protein
MTSAPQEFSLSFLDETADAFFRVFRGLQPALLLLLLSRRHVRPFKCGFPRIGEGRCDRERGLFCRLSSCLASRGESRVRRYAAWLDARLKAAGARYYGRTNTNLKLHPDEILARLVTSFATKEDEIERFVQLCKI